MAAARRGGLSAAPPRPPHSPSVAAPLPVPVPPWLRPQPPPERPPGPGPAGGLRHGRPRGTDWGEAGTPTLARRVPVASWPSPSPPWLRATRDPRPLAEALFVCPRAAASRATCCRQNAGQGRGLRRPGRGGDLGLASSTHSRGDPSALGGGGRESEGGGWRAASTRACCGGDRPGRRWALRGAARRSQRWKCPGALLPRAATA